MSEKTIHPSASIYSIAWPKEASFRKIKLWLGEPCSVAEALQRMSAYEGRHGKTILVDGAYVGGIGATAFTAITQTFALYGKVLEKVTDKPKTMAPKRVVSAAVAEVMEKLSPALRLKKKFQEALLEALLANDGGGKEIFERITVFREPYNVMILVDGKPVGQIGKSGVEKIIQIARLEYGVTLKETTRKDKPAPQKTAKFERPGLGGGRGR